MTEDTDGRLVRDRTPERLRAAGSDPVTRTATGEERQRRLVDTVERALAAYRADGGVADLADAIEAIHALGRLADVDPEAIEAARAERRERLGGYDAGTVLERRDR